MSLTKLLITSGAVIAGMITLAGCFHHPFKHFNKDSQKEMIEKIVENVSDELKLTPQQAGKLNQIKEEIIAKHNSIDNRVEIATAIRNEIKKDKIDPEILNAEMKKINSNCDEMHSFILVKITEFHSVLTKEQKELMAKHIDKFIQSMNQDK